MFRFLVGFTYVLYIFIRSTNSSSVLASFNEKCSENDLCSPPLICSNTSQCICSRSSSIWNRNVKDCFYCPSGWTTWENDHCLSFAVPPGGGLSYQKANETCRSFSGQFFSIKNIAQLKLFEVQVDRLLRSTFSSAVFLYFRLGAWIDQIHIDGLEDIWCDDHQVDPLLECVYIRRNSLRNNSLCLSRLTCQEEMPFICEMKTISEKDTIGNDNPESSNQRFVQILAELAPLALNLLGNLFNPNQQAQQTATPAPPQQIIIQHDPAPAAQAASSDNTMLIVGLIIGGFFLFIIIFGAVGLVLYFTVCAKNSSSTGRTNQRSSVESTLSNA